MSSFRTREPVTYSAGVPVSPTAPATKTGGKKISIIGCGQVGLAMAYSIINQSVCSELALVDINEEKLIGEAKDLRQGSAFQHRITITSSKDYDVTEGSDLVLVTAGAAQRPGQTRLELIGINVKIMKFIIPSVLKYSPKATICIASNPCDILTGVAAKLAGPDVPPGKIFGCGTALDSSRLRCVIARAVGNIDPSSVHGYIIGEHGDSSVAVFSGVRIGCVPFLAEGEKPTEEHVAMHKEVVDSAYDVIKRKGYTNWAIGLSAAHIAKVVIGDHDTIIPVSTCIRGMYGDTKNDVFTSVPCVVGASGVKKVLEIPLSDEEMTKFTKSVAAMWDVQSKIWNF